MANSAAFFDLDRTLVGVASPKIYQRHLAAAGLAASGGNAISDAFFKIFEIAGETALVGQSAKLAPKASKGWNVDRTIQAAQAAAEEIETHVSEFAHAELQRHRDAGRPIVLATTTPEHLVRPLAALLNFDDVVATRWVQADGKFTGELDGEVVWGPAKRDAVRRWCDENEVSIGSSWAYSDSYYDSALLDVVGNPVAVNPDPRLAATAALNNWPIRFLDKPEGIVKLGGVEVQEILRPFVRPELIPNAKVELSGLEHIPDDGPAIVVGNHRSYFDPTIMMTVLARAGRNARYLGKKEVFDVPVIGAMLQAGGGIRVDRGTGSDEPLAAAIKAVNGGDIVVMMPQGTIPRGPAFFDPVLKGRWGAARLAEATRAPVIPVGLWGTEKVWPRSARLPNLNIIDPPTVTGVVGTQVELGYDDLDADTEAIMTAIAALLPPEARQPHTPTPEELAATYPPGWEGDPELEHDRRPGTDGPTKGSDA